MLYLAAYITMQDYVFVYLQICDDPDGRLNES